MAHEDADDFIARFEEQARGESRTPPGGGDPGLHLAGQADLGIADVGIQGRYHTGCGVLSDHAGKGHAEIGQFAVRQCSKHGAVDPRVPGFGHDLDDDVGVLGLKVADHLAQE